MTTQVNVNDKLAPEDVVRIVFAGFIIIALFLSCQNPTTAGNNSATVLQKTDFKVRSTDYSSFCQDIYDSATVVYRDADTMIIVVRSVAGCPPYTLDYQIKNDTLNLLYSSLKSICNDTMRYTYLEYGFKVLKEGNLRIIAEDTAAKCKCYSIDSAIDTREAIKSYNISCNERRSDRSQQYSGQWICNAPDPFISTFDSLWLKADGSFSKREQVEFHGMDTVPYEMVFWGKYEINNDTIAYFIDSAKTCDACGRYDLLNGFVRVRKIPIPLISSDSLISVPFYWAFADTLFGYKKN
jgi:hypothetical protein